MEKTIFVLGAGDGCGNRVAEKFGRNGFRVVLMARSAEHLAAYEAEFKEKGIEVYTQMADASKLHSVTKAFADLKVRFGTPDVLFYNVGVTSLDSAEKDVDLLMDRYMVDVAGAYHAIQQVLGEEFSQKKGAILVTGGGLAMYPMYNYLPLSMDKAALRAMCLALHTGQNIGAGHTDRVITGAKHTVILSEIISICILIVAFLFAEPIVAAFGLEAEAIGYCIAHVRCIAICLIPFASYFPLLGLFQGANDALYSTFVATSALAVRVASTYILQEIPSISYHMIWWNAIFGWGLGCILAWTHFLKGKWRTKMNEPLNDISSRIIAE